MKIPTLMEKSGVKYLCPPQGKRLTIHFVRTPGEYAVLEVYDYGTNEKQYIGISKIAVEVLRRMNVGYSVGQILADRCEASSTIQKMKNAGIVSECPEPPPFEVRNTNPPEMDVKARLIHRTILCPTLGLRTVIEECEETGGMFQFGVNSGLMVPPDV